MLFVTVSLGVAIALASTWWASASPPQFSLTFEGAHIGDSSLPSGLRHEGVFTASAPVCSAGRAYDARQVDDGSSLTVWRLHTCDDGSGSFIAFMPAVLGEHGGSGTWKIVEGTGSFATLRGMGTYTGALRSGDPQSYPTIVYETRWQGRVDFDADPPVVERFAANAKKLRLRPRTYSLRIAVAARDQSTPIKFSASVSVGRILLTPDAVKQTSTGPGKALIVMRIRTPSSARSVRISLTAIDALGNSGTSSRPVRLSSR